MQFLIERKIQEAIDAGEFTDLPGRGRPLDLSENPFEDPDWRMAHRLLRNAGFATAWIEERKDIDAELETARAVLARAARLFHGSQGSGEFEWQRSVKQFSECVLELNRRIKLYNLKTPTTVFQCPVIDVDIELKRAVEGIR